MSSVQRSSRVRTGVADAVGAEARVEAGVPCAVHAVAASTTRPSGRAFVVHPEAPSGFPDSYEVVAHTTSS